MLRLFLFLSLRGDGSGDTLALSTCCCGSECVVFMDGFLCQPVFIREDLVYLATLRRVRQPYAGCAVRTEKRMPPVNCMVRMAHPALRLLRHFDPRNDGLIRASSIYSS
jgi:hypothetical protein